MWTSEDIFNEDIFIINDTDCCDILTDMIFVKYDSVGIAGSVTNLITARGGSRMGALIRPQ